MEAKQVPLLLKCVVAVKLRSKLLPSDICDSVVVVVNAVMFFFLLAL